MTSKEDRTQRYKEVKQKAEKVYQEKILPGIAEPVKEFCKKLSEAVDKNFEKLCECALQTGVTHSWRDFGVLFSIYREHGNFFIAHDVSNSFTLPICMEDTYYLSIEALERAIGEELAQYDIVLEKTYKKHGTHSYIYLCYFSDN